MEPTADNDKYSLPQVIYRAVGWVAGTYQPSEDDVHQGIFVTEDGLSIPAQMTGQLRGRLKHRHPEYATQPDFFSQFFRWIVYPKTEPLRFDLAAMKQLKAEPTTNRLGLDEFCVILTRQCKSQKGIQKFQGFQPKKCQINYCRFNRFS
ncbi:MAG: hypothetical protein KME05_19635 [Gloeocapsa sp. UFS-A4-WI-NPMV-4B04]|jgi:hypothetical protein|nr:hypothetical protein [Gloeocapsa sp. UFS-A4-WI-NPMV-4B04]